MTDDRWSTFQEELLRAQAGGALAGRVFREREFLYDGLTRMGIYPRRNELVAFHAAVRGDRPLDRFVTDWMRHKTEDS